MADIFAPALGAGGDIFGTALFTGITGSGGATLAGLESSGGGSAVVAIVGSGAATLGAISASGSGAAFSAIVGSGAATLQEIAASGYGAAVPTLDGVGVVFLQPLSSAGVGVVISPAIPQINDNGDLSVTIPYYGEAVALDYPQIAAWIAGFTSSVPVTNNSTFLVEVQDSPKAITFSASNQFGTATVTRTLTITVDANDGLLHPNQADLRLNWPYFADPALFSFQQLQQAIENAQCNISDRNYGRLRGQCRLKAIYLMAAHLLAIQQQAKTGGTAGVVTGSSIDKVSVQMMAPPVKNQWQWWLSTTPYGAELLALLQSKSAGGFYIPGSLAMKGFRKAGGNF